MASVNKQSCPTCGQAVNPRKVSMGTHHVGALLKVGLWLKREHRSTAKMSEFKPLLSHPQYSTFNELKHFMPWIVTGEAALYSFDLDALERVFAGDEKVCIEYEVDRIGERKRTQTKFGTLRDAKHLKSFLDENNQYVAQYVGSRGTNQGSLL